MHEFIIISLAVCERYVEVEPKGRIFSNEGHDMRQIFQVEFSADTLRLNLIDLARTGSKLIQVAGRVAYNCPSGDPQDPVTFTTRDSHLVRTIVSLSIFRCFYTNSRVDCCPSIDFAAMGNQ